MPRAGLDPSVVTRHAAQVADEVGLDQLTMGLLAMRLGVQTPSLYKHVGGFADLQQRLAVLALTELADRVDEATAQTAERQALATTAQTIRTYIREHPGRYTATLRVQADGPGEVFSAASDRLIEALSGALQGYGVPEEQQIHALRMLRAMWHGFAMLELSDGFQLDVDVDDSYTWLVDFTDRGLRAL